MQAARAWKPSKRVVAKSKDSFPIEYIFPTKKIRDKHYHYVNY